MPTVFSHAISAVAIGHLCSFKERPWKYWLIGMVCAMLPDIDVLGFDYGIQYGDLLGHRGFSHSFLFAVVWAALCMFLFFRNHSFLKKDWWAVWIYLFLCTASHGILDAMTSGGLGIAFFSPFDTQRYFLPFRPIRVSPIGIDRFFSEWGVRVLKSEWIWVMLPSLMLIFLARLFRLISSKK